MWDHKRLHNEKTHHQKKPPLRVSIGNGSMVSGGNGSMVSGGHLLYIRTGSHGDPQSNVQKALLKSRNAHVMSEQEQLHAKLRLPEQKD